MSISFYEASVETYQRILESVANILEKGVDFSKANDLDLSDFVHAKLRDDMRPLHWQVVAVHHNSWGALQAMREGTFRPPPSIEVDKDYGSLQSLVDEAREGVASFSEEDANNLSERSMIIAAGGREMPFTNQNFLLTFSLPNFYFHAATTYAILRMLGVPLIKRDFLGQEVRRIWNRSKTDEN